ncbi:MAG: site-specific tyrosine recombinase [Termitinemataceae bacterium]|nr:MAG: site-specific tyrosine recombinase [Termitinemataceae bacterium]
MIEKKSWLEGYRSRLLAVERKAKLTVETYYSEVHFFLDWLYANGACVETASENDLVRYLEARSCGAFSAEGDLHGIDARSTAKAISVLRSFFKFVIVKGCRKDNPAQLLEAPKRAQTLPAVMPLEKVDSLLELISTDTVSGKRDAALFELVYSSGLRISEAVGLNVDDVFFDEAILRVTGKGGKQRFVPFGARAEDALKCYLSEARSCLLGKKRSDALFINRLGGRLSRKGIWKNYAALAKQNGTGTKLHTLRHSFATELLSGGADLRSVQELLGHANLATTQIYTHVNVSKLKEEHKKYLPKL